MFDILSLIAVLRRNPTGAKIIWAMVMVLGITAFLFPQHVGKVYEIVTALVPSRPNALPPSTPPPDVPATALAEAKQRFHQGLIFASTGRIDEGIQEFSAAIDLDPHYAAAYGNRGVAYILRKKYNKAEDDLTKAVNLDPKDRNAFYNLTVLYTLQKRFDRALDALDQALTGGFDNYDALRRDADLAELRKHPEFRKLLERHKIFL